MQRYSNSELDAIIGNLTPTELAYIAGLFDGEGCLRLHVLKSGSVSHELTITMTCERVIHWLMSHTHLGSVYRKVPKQVTWRPVLYWTVGGRQAVALMQAIRPWTVVKAPQIDVFLDYIAQECSDNAGYGVRLTEARIERRKQTSAKLTELKLVA